MQQTRVKMRKIKKKNINDSTTLIDEKRAIEAAQAVQNLLKSEKETCLDESGANSENKSVDSSMASKNEKFTKPDGVERRITRSFSKNEDEGDAESDDESSSDISFDFDADDNEDIPESESHSPDILMTETLSVLKDAGPGKSSSRMNNIIERLVSKVVTKSEPIDEAESVNQTDAVNKAESLAQAKSINQPEIRDQAESVSLDQLESTVQPEQIEIARINESDKIHAREDPKSVETNEQVSEVETDAEAVKSSDTSSNVIGKPPPLMSLGELKDKNLLRNAVVSDITVTSAPIRVGPLEVKRFSDGLLYSCCVRGCIFASTNRMLFAMHLTNTHKLSRWDGSCKNCSIYTSEVHAQYKLSEALHHLITYHLVATPDDPMPSTEEAEKKSSLDENKSGIDERKSGIDENKSGISKNKSGINENKSGIDKNKSDIDENKSGIDKNKSGISENKSGIDENKSEPLLENSSSETGDIVTNKEEIVESPAPRKFIRLRRLSGDLLSVPKPPEPLAKEDLQNPPSDVDVPVNILSPMETTQEIEEQEGSTTNEDENGPFLRIESVVSLNPEAMATDDVHDILKAVEDPNTSKSSEKSDSMESSIDITLTTSSKSIFTMPSSSVCSTKSVVTQRPIMTSAPKSYLKASSSSDGQFTMLRGKLMRSHGSMQMIPVTPLSKSSSITLLPGQQMSPVKLSNVQLSPVKLHSLKNIDLTHKSNIPRSLVSLAKITGPTSSKGTIKLSKDRHGGLWQGQVLPAILPKTTTYVRVEIKDNKVTTKQVQLGTKTSSSLLLSSKPSMAPLLMATKALHTVPLTTTNVSFPIPSAQLETEMEAAATTGASPSSSCPIPPPTPTRRPKLNQNIVSPPPVPSTPATSTFLSTTVPKNKIPQKSAVAPSYAKASKLPAVYQEMIKPAKLRHLYKCMARHCSYSTDSEVDYSLHYNEHERRFGLKGMTEKKKGRPAATLKFSEWQQCAYCCAMHTSLSKILEHIQTEHGYCLYQCAYCFYRAVSKAYVILHQNTGHINEHVAVLKCKESKVPQPPQEMAVPRHYAVVPYICGQGNCGAIFYISDNFTRHLEKEHSQLTMYSCHICGNKSFKPERLLAHYKLHSCCYYQCKYCLHGTDTKEDMHHHLCNFHSNQKAHVIIRSSDLQEHGKSEEILESLKILDLDEYMVDDNVLILPPPEDEPAPEDPTVCASQLVSTSNIEGITLLYPDQGQISGNSPSNEEILNAVSAISDSDEQNISGLLETETGNNENGKSDADQSSVKSNDAALQEGQIGSNKRNEDDVVVLDDVVSTPDISKAMQKNQFSTTLVNVKEGIVSQAQDSNIIDEINILSSDKDSDIECLGETNNLLRTESKSNDSQDSDVILLDNNTRGSDSNDVSKKTENADKHEVTSERNDSVLSEPMVTLKHRNPKTVAEIESAVDPLSSMNHTSENLNKSDINSDPRIIQPNELIFNEEPLVTLKHRDPKKFAEIEMAVDPLSLDDVGSSEIRPSNAETEGVSDSGDSKAGLKQGELSGSTLEEMEDTGLTGTSLYRCGYVTCTFSAEDSSLLKDHLLVCDLARDSSSLNCVHCKKQFKYVSSLLEHLRLHGTKRYGCGLCNFRAPVPQQVVKHLKQRHRVNSTKIVPLNPLKSDPETAMFVLFAKDKGKGGRGGKGYGKDGQDLHNKCVFLPEEVDILPRQAIYTKPVRCATCSYTTKVRSNMVRHLQLHISSNIPDVIPPNNAPVNPVPCLEKKEMMFDKMTNLAASSHIAAAAKSETPSGSLTLTQELEGKLPKYVPENQRYVCGAPECSYLTCDETMLRYHLRALHFDETAYRCPHCHESASTDTPGQVISIERMGAHLKMHDSRLYKCAHCIYHHFQRYVVERHLADKHPEKRPFVHVVREPEIEAGSSKAEAAVNELAEPGPSGTVVGTMKNPWQCGMCNFQCSTRSDVLDHTWSMHGLKSQYKCNLCSYRSSSKHGFDAHFASKHPTSTNVELVHVYRRVDVPQSPQSSAVKSGSAGHESVMFDTTPLWRRDMQRIRHIRGILLEEEGDVPKPDIVHRPSIEEFEEEEEEGVVEEQKGKEEQRQEEEKEEKDEPRGLFGPYGKPFGGIYYFCTICNKYRTKFKSDFRDHLFRELKYHKWVCTHCRLMSCSRNALQRHSAKVHEKDRKPEAIAPLTPNKDIEEWVEKVISTQLTLMKSEQQASQESTNKINSASLAQPGPSGLVSRHCKSESSSGVSSVTKLLRFPCKHCKMKFSMARGLKCHIRHIHLKSKLWSCEHCQFVSSDEINVLKHSEVQHPDLPISYSQSSNAAVLKLDDEFWEREYGLGPNSDLNSLSSSSSPTSSPVKKRPRPGSPDLTDENSSASSVVDLPEESYNKCIHCNYFSRSASDLKYHVMRHWVQKPLKCAYCEFGGVREYEIKKHSLKAHPLMKVYIIEKPIPSQPEIRPLQRTKRSKLDLDASSPNVIQNKELRREEITSGVEVAETKKDVEENFQEESRFTSEIPNIFRCFYCPQRGTSLVSIHQHWQEKHKNKSVGSNGVVRPGLPFKYKEVNMKQFLKGQDGSAGRKPALLCAYCKYRGTLTALEEHQRIDHPDKPFQANQACFTRYECAECHFTAFTVNTLKRHFDLEHQGKELQYLVKYTKEDVSGIKDKSKESLASVVCVPKPLPMPVVKTKYMCLWCEETCESEEKIQVHHALCHSHLQLKYSVERSNTPAPVPSVSTKRYGCPVCTFSSETRQIVFEHLYYHAKPYRCGYCIKTFEVPAKVRNHIFVNHPEHEFRMLHLEDVERELAKWRGEIIIRENSESSRDLTSSQKREYESIDLSPKRLCIARKSTTLSPRVRFHAVARKSTNPLPWQSIKHSVMDHMESGDTSPPSSRSESPASLQEYSFYGCRPSPVDKHRITASVKLRNNLGVLMNMSLSTMERFTNMYPVVRLKDLKHEKWMSL